MEDKKAEANDENTFAKEALQCEIGVKLQRAREEKQLSPDYIIKELKFNMTFLNALETGNWEEMPGEVYAIGFLRQYAALLGLDVSAEVERIKSNNYELTAPLTYPDAPISPNRTWVIAAITVFTLVIIMINFPGSDTHEPSIVVSTKQQQPDIEKSTVQSPVLIHDKPITLQDNTPPPMTEDKVEEVSILEVPEVDLPKLGKTYSFYASTNDVWLQVYEEGADTDLVLLREVLLKKGQSFSIIDSDAKLLLTAGNARALEILVDGDVLFAVNTLGQEGKVLKRYPINP